MSKPQTQETVTVSVSDKRTTFSDMVSFKSNMGKIINGASIIPKYTSTNGLKPMSEEETFIPLSIAQQIPVSELKKHNINTNNTDTSKIPDPFLSSVLNENREVQIGDSVYRVEKEYVFIYKEGFYDDVVAFKNTGFQSPNIKVTKLAVTQDYQNSKGTKLQEKYGAMTGGIGWVGNIEYANHPRGNIRMKCWHWYTNFFFYGSCGATTKIEYLKTSSFLWWSWQEWVPYGGSDIKTTVNGRAWSYYATREPIAVVPKIVVHTGDEHGLIFDYWLGTPTIQIGLPSLALSVSSVSGAKMINIFDMTTTHAAWVDGSYLTYQLKWAL